MSRRHADIREIAKSLDEMIDILDQPVKKAETYREKLRKMYVKRRDDHSLLSEYVKKRGGPDKLVKDINKALSFNVDRIHTMTADSNFYSPYRQLADGSYAPHPEEYWNSQGRDYRDSGISQFYSAAGAKGGDFGLTNHGADFRMSMSSVIEETIQKAAPKGAVHQYEDGMKYKKVGDAHWAPVVGKHAEGLKDRKGEGHKTLDDHFDRVERVKGHISRTQNNDDVQKVAQEHASKMVRDVLSKFFFHNGELPTPIKEHLDKFDKDASDKKEKEKVKK